jgi:hypothetical protein
VSRLKTKRRWPEHIVNEAIRVYAGINMNVQDLERLPKEQREAVVKGLSRLLSHSK